MDRPSGPRRKSSVGDVEEIKTKNTRKSFVVGGASKNHHRVPSYGKKLNQLGKLTALTTTDGKNTSDDAEPVRRSSIQRSASQKSLTDVKMPTRRSASSQDVRKMRRSSSNTNHTTISKLSAKPTKAEASKNDKPALAKRPTFTIQDEDDDEEEDEETVEETDDHDVASSFVKDAMIHEADLRITKKENEPVNGAQITTPRVKAYSPAGRSLNAVQPMRELHQRSASIPKAPSKQESPAQRKSSIGLLYHSIASPIIPQLSTEPVTAKDIQSSDRPRRRRSIDESIPAQSQPMTSRFLESPRRDLAPVTTKDDQLSSVHRNASLLMQHSPHGSTTNLGGGASRTQQKLLLQRASSIYDVEGESTKQDVKALVPSQRAVREVERISREYNNVKRFRNPQNDMAQRLYLKGVLAPASMRRSLTQAALNKEESRLKSNQSSQALMREVPADTEAIRKILSELWIGAE